MKRALVLGGAGFIGSHLVKNLVGKGLSVTAVDNLYSSTLANIDDLIKGGSLTFFYRDVRYPLLDLGDFDFIYNLACPASPLHYQRDPVMTINTNVLGAINCLELARQSGARVFQASTSEVYGDPLVHPQPETYFGNVNTFGPRSCYDEGKRCAETIFLEYANQYGVDVRVARIFNTYGPYMHPDDGRVISNFIIQALMQKPISINGSGDQTRSFCYVSDLIDGITALMNFPANIETPVNLGNPCEVSINELARVICDLTSASVLRVHAVGLQDDPMRRMPDITRARNYLGWDPKIPLRDGLIETINYFKSINFDNLARLVA